MSVVWNRVYKSDSSFFGEEPSNFALLCFGHMKASNVKKVLELGAGYGRDTYSMHQMELKYKHWTILLLPLKY